MSPCPLYEGYSPIATDAAVELMMIPHPLSVQQLSGQSVAEIGVRRLSGLFL